MKSEITHSNDRVESFVSAIDAYEPKLLEGRDDAFRIFARFVSRSIDSRYLERHPTAELLPDIESLMQATLERPSEAIVVKLAGSKNGGESRRGTLITCMPDQRFIYSIVRLSLDQLGIKMFRAINTVMPIARDEHGHVTGYGAADMPKESLIWLEVDGDDLAANQTQVEAHIRGRLEAVRAVVEDFAPIAQMVDTLATRLEEQAKKQSEHAETLKDNARLLRWLLNDHFVFLGTVFVPSARGKVAPQGVLDLGIGRMKDWRGIQVESAETRVIEAGGAPFLWIRKSQTESWVYRAARNDHIVIACQDEKGGSTGALVIEGLFSYPALSEPRTQVPLLDRVIESLFTRLKATKGSHRYRTIRNAFNSLPLEYLFALPVPDVHHLVEQVLEVDAEHRMQMHVTADDLAGIAFIFVALPRSHYSDELRSDIRRLLKERLGASSVDDGVFAGNFESVTFHYFLTGAKPITEDDEKALHEEVAQLASPWLERLKDELTRQHGAAPARELWAQWAESFPGRYREETSVGRAAQDIALLQALGPTGDFDCDLYREKDDVGLEVTRLRMFQSRSMLLSDILPILDNFGLIVIDQAPNTLHLAHGVDKLINTFRLGGVEGMSCDLTTRRVRLRNAITAVVSGAMSNDSLNRLLLRADIPWPTVVLVLAYVAYARQLGLPYGQATVEEALLRHADVVRALTELFRAKFDPEVDGVRTLKVEEQRLERVERARRAVLSLLDAVADLASDQVLRTIYNLIDATLRTNFYARDPSIVHRLVLKFDPQLISRMPEPRPYREIYVYHPQVAGLHLRGGPAARGGIRWSDRLLDFRTEVLGLAATQNLKNVLIVPRGAKGAFVLRNPPSDMAQRRAHADEMYKEFISGLLDVTDNLLEGQPVTPANVLCYDGPDHYLVVAADKGTAHLSDTANALALARGFWLGDAFASGGSKGYDHKKEAITSRGAWACVVRHFRELNLHPEKDPIRVIGIGDMSGDVFGNGLLRSKTVQLIGAFDHRHIFLDPNPDAAKSFKARQALFDKPRTSWEDYPKDLISQGGGTYPRSAKRIVLTPEVRTALGTTADEMSGPELVQLMFKAPVDLLWNGGIGTYIKATDETHLDVGDPANDGVRVDATEVRAKVLGEGGNLGITAKGRIELASRGIRLNTDAVDNSAGVDMSDHEVNLKILFERSKSRGAIDDAKRDVLLESVREWVGEVCVSNNWVQSRMLSLDELRSRRDPARFQRAIAFLAERTPFKRRDSNLPGERIAKNRAQKGEGLYRPELAYIAANAKLDLRQELGRAAEIFPLESLKEQLFAYFPPVLVDAFRDDVEQHALAINIARTVLTNQIVGDTGASWLAETSIMTGRTTPEILSAYFGASALLGAKELKSQIEALEPSITTQLEYRLRLRLEDALEEIATWLLGRDAPITEAFSRDFPKALASLPDMSAESSDGLTEELVKAGMTAYSARSFQILPRIDEVLDITLLASESASTIARATSAYFLVGERAGVSTLTRRALESTSSDDLDRPARFALRAQLRDQMLKLATQLLRDESDLTKLSERSVTWLDASARELSSLGVGDRPLCNYVVGLERISRRAISLRRPQKKETARS